MVHLAPPVLLAALLLPPIAVAQTAGVPDPTLPPASETTLISLIGRGAQLYSCKSKDDVPAWTFVAPEATLYGAGGAAAGTHAAGPTWTLKDGSSVHGTVVAQRPSADPDAIPWLLLKAAKNGGPGSLAAVTYIRRSDTRGGKAPSTGCDTAHLGAEQRIPYTATYTFFAAPR